MATARTGGWQRDESGRSRLRWEEIGSLVKGGGRRLIEGALWLDTVCSGRPAVRVAADTIVFVFVET